MLLVRPGELIPCDAEVVDGESSVDTSRLTGEPIPIAARPGLRLLSGCLNLDGALRIRAIALAGESQYARIVELVRTPRRARRPFSAWRTATRSGSLLSRWPPAPAPMGFQAIRCAPSRCSWSPRPALLSSRCLSHSSAASIAPPVKASSFGMAPPSSNSAGSRWPSSTRPGRSPWDTLGYPRCSGAVLYRGRAPRPRRRGGAELGPPSRSNRGRGCGFARHRAATGVSVIEAPGQGVSGTVGDHEVSIGGWRFLADRYPEAAIALSDLRVRHPDAELRAFVAVDGRPRESSSLPTASGLS